MLGEAGGMMQPDPGLNTDRRRWAFDQACCSGLPFAAHIGRSTLVRVAFALGFLVFGAGAGRRVGPWLRSSACTVAASARLGGCHSCQPT